MFSLSGRIFNYKNVSPTTPDFIGLLTFSTDDVKEITAAAYDSDYDDDFFVTEKSDGWALYTNIGTAAGTTTTYSVPVYIEYTDANGVESSIRETYQIYGIKDGSSNPSIKYIESIATKIGTTSPIAIHGRYFDSTMDVFLMNGDFCMKIPHDETVLSHGNTEGTDDTITFVMGPEYAMSDADGDEICATYDIGIGIGDCGSSDILSLPIEFENNIRLIRYKYSKENADASAIASAGTTASTNANCYYTSEISMTYDTTDAVGNTYTDGGAGGKYGDTMYVRLGTGQDCTKMRYFRVKLKYNKRLDRLYGEQTLDGVKLEEGDVVWLSAQMDDTEGLWIVSEGAWIGMSTYLDNESSEYDYTQPCTTQKQVPLAVDYTVFPDLGTTVSDTVTAACSSDVPVKYGSQSVCGTVRSPGDILVLSNQSDGKDGIWEVTCSDWIYRGSAGDHTDTTVDQSDEIIVQNDIDFCTCGTYHIWYYFLNGGCYLATATRTVKIICSGASIVPSNNVIITDYSISTGTTSELADNNTDTAGDPETEDCVKSTDAEDVDNGTYNAENNVASTEYTHGCSESSNTLKTPNCMYTCDCRKYYTVKFDGDYTNSKSGNGFSILFWQFGNGGWHLYAYIGAGNNTTGMNYYVYHLHCDGLATVDKVDENADIEYSAINSDGIFTTERTHDAWFVNHGGVLANGFGLVDDSWNFYTIDDNGDKVMHFDHQLNEDSLYQSWSLSCTTVFLARRDYEEEATSLNRRTTCSDMSDASKTAECSKYIVGMEHVFGFKYYRSVLSMERFCDIYNDYTCVIGDTWSALATDEYKDDTGEYTSAVIVTDQCYDAEGNICDCDEEGAQPGIIEV